MSTDLLTRAEQSVTLTRLQSGQLSFHRYTMLAGVRFVYEMSKDKDVSHISLDSFTRAFHGTATKNTRKRAKQQLRCLIQFLIGEGWVVVPEYDGRELSGMIYVSSIPDDDDDGILDMIREKIKAAERSCDMRIHRINQLKANLRYATEDTDDVDETDECPPAV